MKKLYFLLIFPLLAAAACSNADDSVFGESSTARVRKVMAECAEAVVKPQWGWKMLYVPDQKTYGGYNVLMKFQDAENVKVLTDFLEEESVSTYSFNASQGPVLSFDTKSALHYLADPSIAPIGTGKKGEFEFVIQAITPDSLVFKGKKYGKRVVFYPAEEADWTTRMAAFRANINHMTPQTKAPYFRGLTMNQTAVNLSYNPENRTISYVYSDDQSRKIFTGQSGVYGTETGVRFSPAIKVNGVVLDELKYNTEVNLFEAASPGVIGRLKYSHTPPFPFYNSIAMLKDGSNIAGLPKLNDINLSQLSSIYGFISLLDMSPHMSEELSTTYSAFVLAGMKQFRLSWLLEYDGNMVGPWITYFGGKNLLAVSDQTVDYRLNLEELRPEGDQFRLTDAYDIRRQPNELDTEFQNNMQNTAGFSVFKQFFLDPAGFTVVPESDRVFAIVNLADSRRWIRLTKE